MGGRCTGSYGGSIQNPIHALSTFLNTLHHPNGSVAMPGFYKGVRPIQEEDRADVAAFPFDTSAFLSELGASHEVGEAGFHTLERV